jgi:hypothetical protein
MNIQNEYNRNRKSVMLKKTSNENLFVMKYKREVFYDDSWNDFLRECRGLVIDKDFNIVSYPFTKIHNFRVEQSAPVLSDYDFVTAYEKINGFMVAMTYSDEYGFIVSTTGTIDSDFVQMAKSFVTPELELFVKNHPEFTFLFECVHENDPHIIEHDAGLYYLGRRTKEIGSAINPEWMAGLANTSVNKVLSFVCTVFDLMTITKSALHEGFVFYTMDLSISSKIKSPYYLVKKFFMRSNINKILSPNVKNKVDEEYYPLVDYVKANSEVFQTLDEQGRREFIEKFLVA